MMSGHRGPGTPRDRDQPAADLAAETEATVTAIAGLRWRLRRPETLNDPAVLCELRKLEEQVTEQLDEQDRRNPGRHRSTAGGITGRRDGRQVADARGFDLKPDPLTASTPDEFIAALRRYREWSGHPSWRKMAAQAGQTVVHSTMWAAMNGSDLPSLEVVKAIVAGCGGGDTDLRAFATAWRRIRAGRAGSAGVRPDFLAAPVPALSLVPDPA
jgi:hypothetical protein